MYLSIENFTCPKEQISLYLTVLKQFILSKTVWNQMYINSCKQYGSWSAGFSCKQWRSRSAGLWRSQLIRIHTVFNARCELVIFNQNMNTELYLLNTFVLVQGLEFSTCPEWNGTTSDKSGMVHVFPQPCPYTDPGCSCKPHLCKHYKTMHSTNLVGFGPAVWEEIYKGHLDEGKQFLRVLTLFSSPEAKA